MRAWSASARPTPTPGHLARLNAAAEAIAGLDVFALNEIRAAIAVPGGLSGSTGRGRHRGHDHHGQRGRPGTLPVRGGLPGCRATHWADRCRICWAARCATPVPFSAYLFYKWAGHPRWRARTRSVRRSTRTAWSPRRAASSTNTVSPHIKLKGGVFAARGGDGGDRGAGQGLPRPAAAAGPQRRLDTADLHEGGLRAGRDPGVPGGPDAGPGRHGRGRRGSPRCRWPPTCASSRSISWHPRSRRRIGEGRCSPDHHYWGGLQRSRLLAGICETLRAGSSMHSNSHLGISLAAMVHLGRRHAEPHRTPATPTGRGRPKRSSRPGRCGSSTDRCRCPPARGSASEIDEDCAGRTARAVRHRVDPRPRRHRLHADRFDPSFTLASPRW